MTSLTFWSRYIARTMTMRAVPDAFGPRDRLPYYERATPWRPEQGLSAFVADIVRDQDLAAEAPRIRAFLDYWAPRQGLAGLGLALIEFSFTTNKPGFGVMLYGENRAMIPAFLEWCRLDGISADVAGRCAAVCGTFDDAGHAMVRAEFRPGDPTRTSLSSSWWLDPLRRTGGFVAHLERLPPAHRDPALVARVRAIEASLAPEFFPLFIGLSVAGASIEPKLYFVRYAEVPPLAPASRARRLVEGLGMDAARLAGVCTAYQGLWAASSEPMTQLLVEVPADAQAPMRMNLITCGTRTGAVKDMMHGLADPRFAARSVGAFERVMQTGRAKYVALRLTPEGLSPRVKLYGHACFAVGS